MALDVIVEVFARSPPAILIALSFVLLFIGFTANVAEMVTAGWVFLILGLILQVLWLLFSAVSS